MLGRECLRLAREPRQAVGIGSEQIGENLQRNIAVEPRIAGTIHFALPVGAERTEDLVWTETGTRR